MSYQTTLRSVTKDPKEQEKTTEPSPTPGITWTVLEENGDFNVTLPLGFGKYLFKNSSNKKLTSSILFLG